MQLVRAKRVMAREGLAKGVDGGRADIAIDDADGRNRHFVKRPLVTMGNQVMIEGLRLGGAGRVCTHLVRHWSSNSRTRILVAPSPRTRRSAALAPPKGRRKWAARRCGTSRTVLFIGAPEPMTGANE